MIQENFQVVQWFYVNTKENPKQTEKQQNYGSMVHHSYGNLKEHGPERTFFKQLQDRISTLSRMKQVVSKMLK